VPESLTAERWRRLEALFHIARELPDGDRPNFIESADPELRPELRAMLARSSNAGGLLARAVSAVAREATVRANWIGRRIGPYRLVREIGRGGMGVVYEACRDDDEYRKTVAIKLAPALCDLDLLGERLRQERQILAGLEHPNIARFLDGGSQDGVPYFAMEFVEGNPITAFCRERRLNVRARIELFRQVCAAIHYAHERLVVHRDLKPANILVTRDGVPKLLDFGIAKLLGQDAAASTSGMRLWTPDYTTPEQIRCGLVTTRTDVYLLGLILYELLCDTQAQAADVSSPLALDRSVCEADAPPPSQRAAEHGDHALARQLRGDLDTIVATALRKEPDGRYGSAAALSEDLGRYLEGRPVQARPGSMLYRAWKTARRHRAAVAAAALVTITATAGVIATAYQARRAEHRFQEVRRLANSVLLGIDDRIRNLAGSTEAREWAASSAVAYLNNLARDAGGDRALLLELAAAYQKVGDVQGYGTQPNLGNTAAALESHRKALAILESLSREKPEPPVQRLLARAYQRTGGLAYNSTNRQAAAAEYKRALAIAEKLYAANPHNLEDADLFNSLATGLGVYQFRIGDLAAGRHSFDLALEAAIRRAQDHPDEQSRAILARTRRTQVRACLYTGDLDVAERMGHENILESEALSASQPANATLRRDLMNNYVEMAYVYWHPGFLNRNQPETAVAWHRKALAIARELDANDPSNATAEADLAIAEDDICDALNRYRPAEAIGHCRESIAISTRWPKRLTQQTSFAYLANSLQQLRRYSEALDALRRSLDLFQRQVAHDPSFFGVRQDQLRTRRQLAGLLLAMGDRAAALDEYRQVLATAEGMASEKPANLVCRRDLADTYEAFARYYAGEDLRQSRAWHQKYLDIWAAWPKDHVSSARQM
jgi:tetratricopeptide (TPR) repeat protein